MSNSSPWLQSDTLKSLLRRWYLFFGLCAAEGLYALLRLLSIPADPKNQVLFGLSTNRLLMVGVVLALSLGLAWLGYKSWRDEAWRMRYLHPAQQPAAFIRLICLMAAAALLSWGTLFILELYPEQQLYAYYERFSPLLTWMTLLGIQFSLWLVILRFGLHPHALVPFKDEGISGLVVMGIFLLTWAFVALTGIGYSHDAVAWGEPGVSLLEWQVWLGIGAAVPFLISSLVHRNAIPLGWMLKKETRTGRLGWTGIQRDVIFALVIWLAALVAWGSLPVPRSYFAMVPRPPNFEIYPYSDAANHDIAAQYILIGEGFMDGRVVKRPLLSLFFALLHLGGGQNYADVIALQTLVLALFPVALYLLGRVLHNRLLGMVVAFWAIAREVNIIAATPYSRVSHSKLLLSDLPAALGLVLFTLLVVIWLQRPRRHPLLPLLGGGALGLVMLVRTQSIILLPVVLAAFFLVYRRELHIGNPKAPPRYLWKGGGLLILGILLVIGPWVARNYHWTGRIVFDQTEQTGIIAQRYTSLPGYAMPPRLPGESDEAYTQRFMADTLQYTLTHPAEVARFVTAHFLNNEITTVLVLPVRGSVQGLADALTITRPFWGEWGNGLQPQSALLLLLYLLVIAAGVAASWRRWGVVGLLPLAVNLSYSFSNGLARNSGGRYNLPVDWAGYFYFGIGALELIMVLLFFFGICRRWVALVVKAPQLPPEGDPGPAAVAGDAALAVLPHPGVAARLPVWQVVTLSALLLLFGAALPLAEVVFPLRYPVMTREQIAGRLLAMPVLRQAGVDTARLQAFLAQDGTVIALGRALYPVFLAAGQGEGGYGWPLYEERDYPRLSFIVIGRSPQNVVLPLREPPPSFPNAADVIVVGCPVPGGEYLDASLAVLLDGDGQVVLRDGGEIYNCTYPLAP